MLGSRKVDLTAEKLEKTMGVRMVGQWGWMTVASTETHWADKLDAMMVVRLGDSLVAYLVERSD